MIINLSPQRSETKTEIEVIDENTLKYNGVSHDFSFLQNGDEVDGESPALGKITRDMNGILNISLIWGYDSTGTKADCFPDVVDITSGFVEPVEKVDV